MHKNEGKLSALRRIRRHGKHRLRNSEKCVVCRRFLECYGINRDIPSHFPQISQLPRNMKIGFWEKKSFSENSERDGVES
jgi:hypothetical protein